MPRILSLRIGLQECHCQPLKKSWLQKARQQWESRDCCFCRFLATHILYVNPAKDSILEPFRFDLRCEGFWIPVNLPDHTFCGLAFLFEFVEESCFTSELDRSKKVVAFAFGIAIVKHGLAPDDVVRFDVVEFLAFLGTVEVDAASIFIVAVAEGGKVGLIIHAKSNGHVLGGPQDPLERGDVSYFLILSFHVIHHDCSCRREDSIKLVVPPTSRVSS